MITTEKQRVVFNLKSFVEELEESLEVSDKVKDSLDIIYVEDVVDKLKTFVNNSTEDIRLSSLKYLMKHPSVSENTRMKSFITPCFK